MRVLLAFDGSAGAAQAVALAQTIAWPADSIAYLEAQQADIVERFALIGGAEAAILRRRPGSAIIDDARDFAADLVMVGSRGRGAIASLVLGSVSAEVVDHAPSPVLVARRETLSRVVVATDDSPSARAAEGVVAGWPIYDGVPVDVVSVADAVRPLTSGIAPMFLRQARDAYTQDLQAAVEAAQRIASEAAGRLHDAGRDADAAIRRGDPAAEIIDFAEKRQADLIVLGSRGRSALAEIVLGSVARNVLAASKASVLVVRGAAAINRESGPEHSSTARAGADRIRSR